MSTTPDSAVRECVDTRREDFLAALGEWLRRPSVSAGPAHAGDVHRSADRLAAKLRETGFGTVEMWETPATRPSSPSGRRGTPAPRPSGCTATTTCSPRTGRTAGTPSRPSPSVRTAACTRAARRTARGRPNEKVDLDLVTKGVETAAYLWQDLAEHWRTD